MSDPRAVALRRALSSRERGRGRRYPAVLRERVAAFADARRAEGASWPQIGSELLISVNTLRRWCGRGAPSASRAMLPVELVADPRPGIAVVTASGVRIEGVTLAEAITAARALG